MNTKLKKLMAQILSVLLMVAMTVVFVPMMSVPAYADDTELVIVTEPQDMTVMKSDTSSPTLQFVAEEGEESVGYQWFRSFDGSSAGTNHEVIEEAECSEFEIPLDQDVGVYHYFCVANTEDNIVTSRVATVWLASESYTIWVGGTQVNDANCGDIPPAEGYIEYSGKASYDKESNTVTLDNYVYKGLGYGRGAGVACLLSDSFETGVKIKLKGDNVLTQIGDVGNPYDSHGILVNNKLEIQDDPDSKGSLTVNAVGSNTIFVSRGITANTGLEIKSGTVTANAYACDYYCEGVNCAADVNISGGSLIATAERQESEGSGFHSCGIDAKGSVTIGENADQVIASGHTKAINSNVLNEIDGRGWEDVTGSGAFEVIPAVTEARALDYQRVVFPTPKLISYDVTFKVVNGAWDDKTKADKIVTLSRYDDEDLALVLKPEDIPAVGNEPDKNYEAGSWDVEPSTETTISADTTYTYTYARGEIYDVILAKLVAKGGKSLNLTWNKIDGVDGYDIFFVKCQGNKPFKKVATVEAGKTLKWTKGGLKKRAAYKAHVKAYVMKDGKKQYVQKSPDVHAYVSGYTKKYTNAKSVTVKKAKVSLKKGKTFKIKAKVKKLKAGKRLMPGHEKTLRYMSSDTAVATVTGGGKIKAKAPGTCYVYVFAHNGVSKKVTVTVK